jgi:hypothetical protein
MGCGARFDPPSWCALPRAVLNAGCVEHLKGVDLVSEGDDVSSTEYTGRSGDCSSD